MRAADLLLYGLDEELRDLWGPQLLPREGRLATLHDEEADGVGDSVDGKGIWMELESDTKQEKDVCEAEWNSPRCAAEKMGRRGVISFRSSSSPSSPLPCSSP